jgi:hypothetical protein
LSGTEIPTIGTGTRARLELADLETLKAWTASHR